MKIDLNLNGNLETEIQNKILSPLKEHISDIIKKESIQFKLSQSLQKELQQQIKQAVYDAIHRMFNTRGGEEALYSNFNLYLQESVKKELQNMEGDFNTSLNNLINTLDKTTYTFEKNLNLFFKNMRDELVNQYSMPTNIIFKYISLNKRYKEFYEDGNSIEDTLILYYKENGYSSIQKFQNGIGSPDLELIISPNSIFIEIKLNNDGIRKEQIRWAINNPDKKIMYLFVDFINEESK